MATAPPVAQSGRRRDDPPAWLVPAGYEPVEELGRGSLAVVHRLRRRDGRGCDVALKTLRDPSDRAVAASFRREGALLACVASLGLAAVHEVGEVNGSPYLVMELIEGRTLAQRLADGPLEEGLLLGVGLDVSETLAEIHRVGLVHRDVKPDNLIVTAEGRARLIDVGLAVWAGDGTGVQSAGTPVYSAPEQTGLLDRAVDARTDLYALGVVLYECAAGVAPFDAEDAGALLRQHATLPPPDLAARRLDLPGGLVAVIERLLAKDPDDRYRDADAVAEALRALPVGSAPEATLARRGGAGAAATLTAAPGRQDELRELLAV